MLIFRWICMEMTSYTELIHNYESEVDQSNIIEPLYLGKEIEGGINKVYFSESDNNPEDEVYVNNSVHIEALERAAIISGNAIKETKMSYYVISMPDENNVSDSYMRIKKKAPDFMYVSRTEESAEIMDCYLDIIDFVSKGNSVDDYNLISEEELEDIRKAADEAGKRRIPKPKKP